MARRQHARLLHSPLLREGFMRTEGSIRSRIYDTLPQCIGHTPLIRLTRVMNGARATVVAKLESFNPLWSVKDRIAREMIDAAERRGHINTGTTKVEPPR